MDFLNKLLPQSQKQRQQLQTIVAAVVGVVATIGLAWFFLRASDQSATVLFVNSGECPEVTLYLRGDGRTITSSLKPGEEEEIDVIPDITYKFEIDHSSDPDEAGFSCLDYEPGQFTVPRGSTFTIYAESQQRPYILLINDTECPEVTLTLWEAEDLRANIDDVTLAPGEEVEIEITPDKRFEYRIRMDSDIEDDERCYEVESGTVNLAFDDSIEVRIASLTRVEHTIVLFKNEGQCPEVTLTLIGNGTTLTSSLSPGEQEEIEVVPDITYDFTVDHSSEPNEEGFSCLDFEPGRLTVPRGSTFTIIAESQQRPYILLINDTECPEVTLTLWEAEDLRANIDDVTLAPGEEAEIEITPDKQFEYRIRMDSDIEDDERCYEVESGTVNLSFDDSIEVRIASLTRVESTSEDSE